MENEDLQSELGRLRAEVEAYRQKELADLRQRVLEAEQLRDHYRQEAQRNADIGRQIASEYELKLAEMKSKVEFYENSKLAAGRPTRDAGR